MIAYTTKDERATEKVGEEIATRLHGGDIVTLTGELGTGKTTLIKGVLRSFGIHDVVSPTFTLMQEYTALTSPNITDDDTVARIIHVDTYRLENARELIDIGIEDYLGRPDTVCLVEWPEKIQDLLQKYSVRQIELRHNQDGTRTITERV